MLKNNLSLAIALLLSLSACTAPKTKIEDRPKLMWVDLSANWARLNDPDSAEYYVNKCADAGFNTLIVDVKGTGSAVAYESEVAPVLREWKGVQRKEGYDFLGTMVRLGHERGMKVYASFNVFCEGHGIFRKGIIYDEKSEWQSINYVPGKGLVPVTEIEGKATAFVNPALKQVQKYEQDILVECVTKYDIDGVMLDRTRYDALQSDFSDFSKKAFEEYAGVSVERFPEDIFEWVPIEDGSYTKVEGKWFKKWIEWRASVIYNFFKDTRDALKAARKDVNFGAYTGAWYPSYYEVGVNWASKEYDPSKDYDWATPEYRNYAYAELLDLYTNGNYYKMVTLEEFRKSNGTYLNETDSEISVGEHLCVEGACKLSRKLLGKNPFCGGIYVEDYKGNVEQFKAAVKMNLKESDGLMIFDMVHIVENDWWDALKEAIEEQEALMK